MHSLNASLVAQKVKNLPANAGDMGSVLDLGRSEVAEQLSLGATIAEPGL